MRLPRAARLPGLVEHRRLHHEALDAVGAEDLHGSAAEVQVDPALSTVIGALRPLLDHLDVARDGLVLGDGRLAGRVVDPAPLGQQNLGLLELAEFAQLLRRPRRLSRTTPSHEMHIPDG